MDSVSQMALGASIAYVAVGKPLGRKALLVGAVLGTLPDLDVVVPYEDAIASFTYHRSWSHSLFVLSLLSVPIAWICHRLASSIQISYQRWLSCVGLILITHVLLDAFTVYGTQIWWPLSVPPTAVGNIFIIDPIYTVPLLIGIATVIIKPKKPRVYRWVYAGLTLSTCYLAWTLVSQNFAHQKLEQTLAKENIEAERIVVAPFPFSLLWRVVVVSDDSYYEGFTGLLDSNELIDLVQYNNGKTYCQPWLNAWPVARLNWFTQGAFALSVKDSTLVATDLRMGIEDDYVFEFNFAERNNDQWQAITTRQRPINIDGQRMQNLFKRMFDESVDVKAPMQNLSWIEQCSDGPT